MAQLMKIANVSFNANLTTGNGNKKIQPVSNRINCHHCHVLLVELSLIRVDVVNSFVEEYIDVLQILTDANDAV